MGITPKGHIGSGHSHKTDHKHRAHKKPQGKTQSHRKATRTHSRDNLPKNKQPASHQSSSLHQKKLLQAPHITNEDVDAWLKQELNDDMRESSDTIPEPLMNKDLPAIYEMLPNMVSTTPVTPSKPVDERAFDEAEKSLEQFRKELGGTPNFKNKPPSLALNKSFMGISMESIRCLISRELRNKRFPKHLWQALGKFLGVQAEGFSRFEYISLSISSLRRLKQLMPEIEKKALKSGKAMKHFVNKNTGLFCHPELNGTRIALQTLKDYVDAFEAQFSRSQKEGTQEEFYNEFFDIGDVCVEARTRGLQSYLSKYYGMGVNPDEIPDYDSTTDTPIDTIFSAEVSAYLTDIGKKQNDYMLTRKDLEAALSERLLGQSFSGRASQEYADFLGSEATSDERRTITEKDIQAFLDYAENILMIF